MGELLALPVRSVPDEILTRRELACRLRVSLRTIDRWVVQGLPSEKWGPRTRRFRVADVDRYLKRLGETNGY